VLDEDEEQCEQDVIVTCELTIVQLSIKHTHINTQLSIKHITTLYSCQSTTHTSPYSCQSNTYQHCTAVNHTHNINTQLSIKH